MKTSHLRFIRRLTLAIFFAALITSSVVAQTNVAILTVQGAVEQPLKLTLSDLQAMPRTKMTEREKDGSEVTFEGVALCQSGEARQKALLTDKCCSNAINTVVVIKAADNYQACTFQLPEL